MSNETALKSTPELKVNENNTDRGYCYPREESNNTKSFDCNFVSKKERSKRICGCSATSDEERKVYKPDGSDLSIVLTNNGENCDKACKDKNLTCNWKSLFDAVKYTNTETIQNTVTQLGMKCWPKMSNETALKSTPELKVNENNTDRGYCYPREESNNTKSFDCNFVSKKERSKRICGCSATSDEERKVYKPDGSDLSIVLSFFKESCAEACSNIGRTCTKDSLKLLVDFTRPTNISDTVNHLGLLCSSIKAEQYWTVYPQIQQLQSNHWKANCFPRRETDLNW
eukprot:CAMPEP_0197840186 /NCGR_PEP_ID=MMETSP1437-20131217/45458_1 /TAXON_ID=49252 ORGANISM="Eucampia antarctica, Strain CCMP1452" /NCGR_SAMPLE_ID=MMETSP1437 /ASSEMBLY_ACC=CAM_ASM_001096 /LENGTH=284 /DNA_ID=CAMNT_0043449751 /DNA_START=192 /DNA_END=1043 /DNA_ORIENTATION=+